MMDVEKAKIAYRKQFPDAVLFSYGFDDNYGLLFKEVFESFDDTIKYVDKDYKVKQIFCPPNANVKRPSIDKEIKCFDETEEKRLVAFVDAYDTKKGKGAFAKDMNWPNKGWKSVNDFISYLKAL